MTDTAPIVGLQVQLQRTCDVQCSVCGGTDCVVGHGTGPHAASLSCVGCGRRRGWLPKAAAQFLLDTVQHFGRPVEPVIIRNSTIEFAAKANGATAPVQLWLPLPAP